MKRLRDFYRLPRLDRQLLFTSLLLLGLVRVGLWLLPFQALQHLLARLTGAHTKAHTGDRPSLKQVARAVTVASRSIPATTCLTQALATQVLLSRHGYVARLRLGVARSEAGIFQAHAWVECQEQIVIGGAPALSRFTPLPSLERGRR